MNNLKNVFTNERLFGPNVKKEHRAGFLGSVFAGIEPKLVNEVFPTVSVSTLSQAKMLNYETLPLFTKTNKKHKKMKVSAIEIKETQEAMAGQLQQSSGSSTARSYYTDETQLLSVYWKIFGSVCAKLQKLVC